MDTALLQVPSNAAYRELMMNMMLDIMAKQNIILAQLTDMNKYDPDFIDSQIIEEKKTIMQQFGHLVEMAD